MSQQYSDVSLEQTQPQEELECLQGFVQSKQEPMPHGQQSHAHEAVGESVHEACSAMIGAEKYIQVSGWGCCTAEVACDHAGDLSAGPVLTRPPVSACALIPPILQGGNTQWTMTDAVYGHVKLRRELKAFIDNPIFNVGVPCCCLQPCCCGSLSFTVLWWLCSGGVLVWPMQHLGPALASGMLRLLYFGLSA